MKLSAFPLGVSVQQLWLNDRRLGQSGQEKCKALVLNKPNHHQYNSNSQVSCVCVCIRVISPALEERYNLSLSWLNPLKALSLQISFWCCHNKVSFAQGWIQAYGLYYHTSLLSAGYLCPSFLTLHSFILFPHSTNIMWIPFLSQSIILEYGREYENLHNGLSY